jgi:hypothetical protein
MSNIGILDFLQERDQFPKGQVMGFREVYDQTPQFDLSLFKW